MPRLVHITSGAAAKAIMRSGIRAGANGVVYFMPLIAGHYLAHQWARELKRRGARCFAAVHFELPADQPVWHGRYNQTHAHQLLAGALAAFLASPDQVGYEFFLSGRVDRRLIRSIREIPRPLGWRYHPEAHGRKPCSCPACQQVGEYGSGDRRREWEAEENRSLRLPIVEAKAVIRNSADRDRIHMALRSFPERTRRESPEYLFRALALDDEFLLYETLKLIGRFAHPLARAKLLEYRDHADDDIRELIVELMERRGWPLDRR